MRVQQALALSRVHTQLALSTAIDFGIYWCMNQLSGFKIAEEDKIAFSWIIPGAQLVNHIWKQTLASQLPEARSHTILKVATDPKTYVAVYLASKFLKAPYLGWPTTVATAVVVGTHSLKSCKAAIEEQRNLGWMPVHLFNAVGTGLLALDSLGIREMVDRTAWEKALLPTPIQSDLSQEQNEKLSDDIATIYKEGEKRRQEDYDKTQKEIEELDKKAEADKAAREAEIKKLKEAFEKSQKETQENLDRINARFTFKKGQNPFKEPDNCPAHGTFNAKELFTGQENLFERLTHKNLNPDCIEHAKFILAQSKWDRTSSDKLCDSIKKLHKHLSVATYPDTHTGNPLAHDANANVNRAYDTLEKAICG